MMTPEDFQNIVPNQLVFGPNILQRLFQSAGEQATMGRRDVDNILGAGLPIIFYDRGDLNPRTGRYEGAKTTRYKILEHLKNTRRFETLHAKWRTNNRIKANNFRMSTKDQERAVYQTDGYTVIDARLLKGRETFIKTMITKEAGKNVQRLKAFPKTMSLFDDIPGLNDPVANRKSFDALEEERIDMEKQYETNLAHYERLISASDAENKELKVKVADAKAEAVKATNMSAAEFLNNIAMENNLPHQ